MDIQNKKTLGIAGGMGSHAGAWLLQRIIDLSHAVSDQDNLDIILHNNSRIPDRTRAIVYHETSPLPELKRTFRYFNDCDIEVALLGCMTAHYYYEELNRLFRGTLLNVPEIVLNELLNSPAFLSKKKIGLVGSTGLLKSGIFQNKFLREGLEPVVLNDEEQEHYFMQPLYMKNGIKSGNTTGPHITTFLKQFDILIGKGCELIIGACSEVPLVVDHPLPVPFLNAFDLLALKAVQYCYNIRESAIPVYH